MIFRYYFRVIQQVWWLIAVVALAAWTVSLGISYTSTPLYRASASLIVFPNASLTSSRDVVTSLDTLDKRSITSTYEDILNSERVFEEAVKTLNVDKTQAAEYKRYTVVQADSNTINLVVEGPDPRLSAKMANSIAENSIRYIKGIYQVFDISFLDQAVPASMRFKPQAFQNGAIALGLGFLAGSLLAIIIEQLRVPLESLRKRSITDKVTTAYTTRHFKSMLDQEMARSTGDPLCLALLELEGLQDVVDALPEGVLTSLMTGVTETLRRQLRGNDIIGRWSQTSYAFMLPGTPGPAAARTMERIRQALTSPVKIGSTGETLSLVPCVGLTDRTDEAEPVSQVIQRAETALQRARQSDQKTVFITNKSIEE